MNPPAHPMPALRRKVLLAGATGLVGRQLLRLLLADDSVEQVVALGRRAPDVVHPKLTALVVDFRHLPALSPVDEVCLALGTTIRVAGSREAFRAVDFEANLAVAHAVQSHDPRGSSFRLNRSSHCD